MEAHNPTGAELPCTLIGAAGFAPLKVWRREMRIPPFSSVKERLPSAPGTVKQQALR
jgi:hypothetical protein